MLDIPFSKHTLGNGLDVLLHEDRACPIVAVNLWYHVGSKNERPGHTGFAHLFEHLMFEGSQHHDHGYFAPLQRVGGTLNGSTNADRTNYWEVVPSSALELALWMESDRMGFLLPALTAKKFENQREVVRLKFQAGLSYAEISRVTGHSVSNVGFLLHTALKTLRRQMQREDQ